MTSSMESVLCGGFAFFDSLLAFFREMPRRIVRFRELCTLISAASIPGIRPSLSQERVEEYRSVFKRKNYNLIIDMVMRDLWMDTRIDMKFGANAAILEYWEENYSVQVISMIPDELKKMASNVIPPSKLARIFIDYSKVPRFGTDEFRNYRTKVLVGESMKFESADSFVMCIVHELTHLLLCSKLNLFYRDESSIDLSAMALGFRDIMKSGRIGVCGKPMGYLTEDWQFKFAYHMLKPGRRLLCLALRLIGD